MIYYVFCLVAGYIRYLIDSTSLPEPPSYDHLVNIVHLHTTRIAAAAVTAAGDSAQHRDNGILG